MGFISQSYIKVSLEPIRTQNLESLPLKLSQSNLNLRSPDFDLVCSYLIATVKSLAFKLGLISSINTF